MVMMPSQMIPLGTPAPAFALPDVTTGDTVSLESFAGRRGLLVMFLARHCPYVVHVQDELARLGRDYGDADLGIVAIGSNDPGVSPDDHPDRLAEQAREVGFGFPYVHDATQAAAKAFLANCTPDIYLFDANRKLAYRGQIDASRPESDVPVTGKDLRAAIDAVLAGEAPSRNQLPSCGCSIKWRPGNAPEYFGR